jgi:hypothetical protein
VGVVSVPLDGILRSHFLRYPNMQVADLYKLLHQAALGSEHAVGDEQVARVSLEKELLEMGTGPADPLIDPLSPDGKIRRVHLRSYIQAGKNPETLLQAFIHTANEWHGSPEKLKEYGAAAARTAGAGTGSVRREEIEAFFAEMGSQGFPAVHHSTEYKRLYRPAYRVVASRFLEAG